MTGMRTLSLVLAATVAIAPVVAYTPAHAQTARVSSSSAAQPVKLGLNKSIVVDLPADA